MNKKYKYFFITILVIFFFVFKQQIISYTLYLSNQTKFLISDYYSSIKSSISNHFNQIEKIKTLQEENQKLKNKLNQLIPIVENYQKLALFKQLKNPKVTFVKTISYAQLPDMSKIYINYNHKINSPKGLIYNNTTAGIVVKHIKNFSIAYLNNNEKTSYAVFIGKNKVPGILFGGNIIKIKYIPKYSKIKKGDLVITSGLDTIFYEGINVGIIAKITKKTLYQEATIKPFYNPLHPTFFYVVGN